jgi:osmoprotectant transport system ATP-binding protein
VFDTSIEYLLASLSRAPSYFTSRQSMPRENQTGPVPNNQAAIDFRNAGYRLADGRALLSGLNLTVQSGETLAMVGRSGAGKSTALKLINRMLEPSEGEVFVNGQSTKNSDPIALRRHIGYVIQEIGLFPHYTVKQNVALVPQLERWPEERTRARVEELLQLVGLDPGQYWGRYPHELSGGQRQRVGIARALAADPPILLMDEPFGALDSLTRAEVLREFQNLEKNLRKTIVLVTHQIGEALLLGSRIAVLDAGKLAGVYTPREFLAATEPLAAEYVKSLRMYEEAENQQ